MKRLLLCGIALAPLFYATSPMAADLGGAYKVPPVAVAPLYYNWTGCYIGAHIGGTAMRDALFGSFADGAVGGGQLGCNYQFDHLVVGLEGEGYGSSVNSTATALAFAPGAAQTAANFKSDWGADIAVRFGLAYDRFLVYGKLGASWADHEFTTTTTGPLGSTTTGNTSIPGFLWGIGLEYGLSPQWTAKFETDFIFYSAKDVNLTCSPVANCGGGGVGIGSENSFAVVTKIGANYRF
jgi:outer membrane immunogenic protein